MGFFDWVNEQKGKLAASVKRYANKDFMEAVAAGCALIATADGTVSKAEKQKVTSFITMNEALKVFEQEDVLAKFNYYIDMFEFNFNVGKVEAIKAIGKLKRQKEAAKTCVAVCSSIGAADGSFDANERRLVNEICFQLDLNPAELQLEF